MTKRRLEFVFPNILLQLSDERRSNAVKDSTGGYLLLMSNTAAPVATPTTTARLAILTTTNMSDKDVKTSAVIDAIQCYTGVPRKAFREALNQTLLATVMEAAPSCRFRQIRPPDRPTWFPMRGA